MQILQCWSINTSVRNTKRSVFRKVLDRLFKDITLADEPLMKSLVNHSPLQHFVHIHDRPSPRRPSAPRPANPKGNHEAKRLEFLDRLGQLVIYSGDHLEHVLEGVVRLLPSAWQHTQDCCARVEVQGHSYATPNWRRRPGC